MYKIVKPKRVKEMTIEDFSTDHVQDYLSSLILMTQYSYTGTFKGVQPE